MGAQIAGDLDCDGATFRNPLQQGVPGTGRALYVDSAKVGGYVFLRNGFTAEGEVNFLNAEIGSNFECDGATLKNPSREALAGSAKALNAHAIRVSGSVLLGKGFRADGEVNLSSADIGSNLVCENGTFKNPAQDDVSGTGRALNADRINVAGYVFLRNGFSAEGEVNFLSAQIGSNLECDGATLKNPAKGGASGTGRALFADRIKVGGYVFLRNGFSAEGEVNFLNARIGSDFICSKSTFKNPPQAEIRGTGLALWLDGASIEGSVFLTEGFSAEGDVRLLGAEIGGDLTCVSSRFGPGLTAQTTSVKRTLWWNKIVQPETAKLDLVDSSVGALVDDRASWPAHGNLRLDGFLYERFSGQNTPKAPKDRLNWLARHKGFAPQPYRQLAKVLRDEGDDSGARLVLFEMEHRRRQKEDRGWFAHLRSLIFRLTVGYGYYPRRALLGLLILAFLGFAFYRGGYFVGSVAPTDKDAHNSFRQSSQAPPHYRRFHASVYSLESSFPLVRLGQADRWQPDPDPQWACKPTKKGLGVFCRVLSPTVLDVFRVFQICVGWFLATMGVAAVTGIVRKD